MNTTFDHIILKTELAQSETFGVFYEDILDQMKAVLLVTC